MTDGPLHGVRILELSIILSAPFGGMHLSDLGADVIKVEPLTGDTIRNQAGGIPGSSKFFQVLNRGRRGLSIDLTQPEGQAIFHRLVPTADVVLINYRPGVAKRLAVDYETLRAIKNDIIYAEISGYGFEGPIANLAASDMTASAYGGVVGLTDAYEDDGAPRSLQPPISGDQPSGLAIAMGIIAALYHRERTGEGQLVQTSLLRSVMAMTCYMNNLDPVQDPSTRDLTIEAMRKAREAGGSYDAVVRARRSVRPVNLYFKTYRAKDGGIAMGALTPANRAAIRKVLGLEGDDQDDPSYEPSAASSRPLMEARMQEISDVLLTRTVADWTKRFNDVGAPVAPVHFPEELIDDEQASLHYTAIEHPLSGTTHQVKPMVDLAKTPTRVQGHAPLLGQHTSEVLESAGFSAEEIARFAAKGLVNLG